MNYFNNEFIEMGISVIIIKGLWDIFTTSFDTYGVVESVSVIIPVCYLLYFLLIVTRKKVDSFMKSLLQSGAHFRTVKALLDSFYFITYLVLIGLWSSWWALYDYIVIDMEYQTIIFIATHILTALLMIFMNLSTVLGGFGTTIINDYNIECDFDIEYFTYFRQNKNY